jgi:hypothetical protein
VSFHSSKGDGRNVVFIIGLNESALKRYSQESNNLIYDSLLHVALTRMKEKLYIRYEENNDDITQKINRYNNLDKISKERIPHIIKISKYIKYDDIIDISINENYNWVNESIINKSILKGFVENTEEKRIIDMGNHLIRYSSLFINIIFECVKKERNNKDQELKKQLMAILYKITEIEVVQANNLKEYYNFIKLGELPIICISNKGKDYIKYFDIIIKTCHNLQLIIKNFLKKNTEIILCPFQCVILYYMIDITKNKEYSQMNIVNIYDLIDIYNSSFNDNTGHEICLCKTHFNICHTIKVKNKKIDSMKLYLMNHFDKINDIKHTMMLFHKKYPKINWLFEKSYFSNDLAAGCLLGFFCISFFNILISSSCSFFDNCKSFISCFCIALSFFNSSNCFTNSIKL